MECIFKKNNKVIGEELLWISFIKALIQTALIQKLNNKTNICI